MKIISRQAAIAAGLDYYYTGKPRKHGHDSPRRRRGSMCVACEHMWKDKYKALRPLYGTYNGMMQRCYNDSHNYYDYYGGRGISVCDRWFDPVDGYDNFVADMGTRPEGFTLDRIDGDGNYEPSNCRWADAATQNRNKSNTVLTGEDLLEIFRMRDAGMTQQAIADHFKVYRENVRYSLKNREKYIARGLGSSTQAAAG
jgi:hypothetical protein